jgi:hypothetical protein
MSSIKLAKYRSYIMLHPTERQPTYTDVQLHCVRDLLNRYCDICVKIPLSRTNTGIEKNSHSNSQDISRKCPKSERFSLCTGVQHSNMPNTISPRLVFLARIPQHTKEDINNGESLDTEG